MDESHEQSGHHKRRDDDGGSLRRPRSKLDGDDAATGVGIGVSLMTFLAGALVYILCIIFPFRLAGVLAHIRPYFVDRFTTQRGMEFARRYSPDKEKQRNAIGTEIALSTVDPFYRARFVKTNS